MLQTVILMVFHTHNLGTKHSQTFNEAIILTDVNPAYGEVKKTNNTVTVYEILQ